MQVQLKEFFVTFLGDCHSIYSSQIKEVFHMSGEYEIGFPLVVILFILLIVIGAICWNVSDGTYYGSGAFC